MRIKWRWTALSVFLVMGLALLVSADAFVGTSSFAAGRPESVKAEASVKDAVVKEPEQKPEKTFEEEYVFPQEAVEVVEEETETETEEVTTIFESTMMQDNAKITYQEYDMDAPAKTYEEERKEIVDAYEKRQWKNWIVSTASVLNIRDKASKDGKIIGKLPKNGGGKIIEYNKDETWVKIKSGPVTGWVSTEYIISGDEVAEVAERVGSEKVIVITETLYARMEPTTESKIVTILNLDEEFELIKKDGEWGKIAIDDDEAWVKLEYVTISFVLEKAVVYKEPEPEPAKTSSSGSSKSSSSSSSSSKTSSVRSRMVSYAMQFLGNPYVWGGTSLTRGTDCSGFTMRIYEHFGYSIPRTSRNQASGGTRISLSNLKPGDLIFYSNSSGINHVAMYIGNGQVIHASNARSGIKISNMNYRTPTKAVRYIKD
ncbi:MAG: C40 family peptidase [Lachnospiraceae bacterium]|nr:C40 family peptidase [Lachnospiraceae bacterium]